MVDRAQAAWKHSHITGMLLIDVEGAFPSVPTGRLVNFMEVSKLYGDLIRWMESFVPDRMVQITMECNAMEAQPV